MQKPSISEYGSYYQQYIDLVDDSDLVELLKDQQSVTIQFLHGISKQDWDYTYALGKWTIKQILGHIIDTERVFTYRVLCFARKESIALPGFDQDAYVENGAFDERTPESLIEEYNCVRKATLSLASSISEEASLRRGIANEKEISVRALFACCCGHEKHHIQVIKAKYLKG